MRIEALLFDLFGTLFDWRRSIARALEAELAPLGHVAGWDGLALAWRELYQPAMEAVRSGRRPYVRLDVLHAENLERVLERAAIRDVPEEVRRRLVLAWHRLDPWPDVREGLRRLRRIALLAPCSNAHLRMAADLARNADLVFDAVLGAELAGTYKPRPEVYLRAVELLDAEPAGCVMVAAHNDDLRAARALGLKTAFVPRPQEWGLQAGRDLAPEEAWDFVAPDLGALAAQMERALGGVAGRG
ncbi:Haloacetate dehalogenase H-2 [bacterium HR39]|nr:Haloacetate dehalogenase H-2 [bacterium HR39]